MEILRKKHSGVTKAGKAQQQGSAAYAGCLDVADSGQVHDAQPDKSRKEPTNDLIRYILHKVPEVCEG